jgi:hypothetical protein
VIQDEKKGVLGKNRPKRLSPPPWGEAGRGLSIDAAEQPPPADFVADAEPAFIGVNG